MRVNEIKQGDCCGLCDTAICKNQNCPRWQKQYDREQYREFCEYEGLKQALEHEDAGDRI